MEGTKYFAIFILLSIIVAIFANKIDALAKTNRVVKIVLIILILMLIIFIGIVMLSIIQHG